jgi:steroid delta-isomerase-like uncharacterized protein
MTTQSNKAVVERFVEPWNTGDFAAFDETVGEKYLLHPDSSIDDLKNIITEYREAFPDLTITIEESIAAGDKVAYRWTMRGTHQREMEGIRPTGRAVEFSGITIVRLEEGKIVEDRFESESLSPEEQLRVTDSPQ